MKICVRCVVLYIERRYGIVSLLITMIIIIWLLCSVILASALTWTLSSDCKSKNPSHVQWRYHPFEVKCTRVRSKFADYLSCLQLTLVTNFTAGGKMMSDCLVPLTTPSSDAIVYWPRPRVRRCIIAATLKVKPVSVSRTKLFSQHGCSLTPKPLYWAGKLNGYYQCFGWIDSYGIDVTLKSRVWDEGKLWYWTI